MQKIYIPILSIITLSGATIREMFPDYTSGEQDPQDVVPGCYGGRLELGSDQLFFDSDNFEWSVEVLVGVGGFDSVNIYMKRHDPTGQFSEAEMVCRNQVIRVVRDDFTRFVDEVIVEPSECLREMAREVMIETESKLASIVLRWMPMRYVFAFNAMALVHKPRCEFLGDHYEAERVLVPVTTAPVSTETIFLAGDVSSANVNSGDMEDALAAYVQRLMDKYRVSDE